ncbi:MAG: tRNA (adenosine(37)-N6)-threonylcarbamoyltransferase complex ATPase subunit type 1 TsaE [Candidatus Krumholzibacteriota bacterium]|nr:tRNA (adenosine(37)-N6)-threonylcarbamoyltransferase complex ATPase subunit type 1 TsaE [Candidatus Krumholzibacteriota bacterium]
MKLERMVNLSGPVREQKLALHSPAQTLRLGVRLGKLMPPGTLVSLEGGLGAGKTLLVKGMARGLGVKTEVLSPTFILLEEYRGELPLWHFDLYRLEEVGEVEKIGLFDAVDGNNIVVVEWGDRLPRGMLEYDLIIRIRITGENSRDIDITCAGNLFPGLMKDLF